ncbi:MAG: Hsp20/alpha crystallin family protein [Nanoarchaeota archaeon]
MVFEDGFFDELKRMQKSLNRFFSDFDDEGVINLRNELSGDYRKAMSDFKETENEFIINVELPGMKKEDIKLNINNDLIEIKARNKKEKEKNKNNEKFYSKSFSGFYQAINLPENADSENIKAKYENGVLKLTIPKKEKSKKDKKYIKID